MARRAGHAVRLEIVGDQPASVVQQIRAIGDDQGVSLRQQVEHRQMVAEICAAGALVLIQAPADAPVQAVAGKTYDYLRAGRPILFVGPEGDNAELIRCHAARYEHPEDDPAAIAAAIARLHRDWQAGRLSERRVSAAFMTTYGRRQQTAQLANHFTRLVQGGSA
jgi:hypothetical protein